MKIIDDFTGDNLILSNFGPGPVVLDIGGVRTEYFTNEHWYQANKALFATDHEKIRLVRDPDDPDDPWKAARLAKRMGRGLKPIRKDWDSHKFQVMRKGLRLKFQVDNEPGEFLLGTGDAMLVEGNTWGDTLWGVYQGKGENWLGHLLMARRAELVALSHNKQRELDIRVN